MLACRTSATLTVTSILDAGDVEQVAAVLGDQRIDEQHVGAELDEAVREVAADEAEAAGDHHAPAAIESARRVIAFRCSCGSTSSPPQLHHVDRRPEDARKVEELRLAVGAMVVMHRMLGDAKAGVLELLHHLQADHAAVLLEAHDVEDAAPHQAEIAVDVAHLQAEQQLHHVVIDAADDDAVQRVGAADLPAVHPVHIVGHLLPQQRHFGRIILAVAVGVEDEVLASRWRSRCAARRRSRDWSRGARCARDRDRSAPARRGSAAVSSLLPSLTTMTSKSSVSVAATLTDGDHQAGDRAAVVVGRERTRSGPASAATLLRSGRRAT